MSLLNPKINWTPTEFYNPEDLNRVENNINETYQALLFFNENLKIEPTVSSRNYLTIEFAESLNRIERNIEYLKGQFFTPVSWQETKTNWKAGDKFSYLDAIRLEKNIVLLYELIGKAKESIKYCGTFYCGQ